MQAAQATHEKHMQRALELAARGVPEASPNPFVGCVVVKESEIIGEGWHQKVGGPHAEVAALDSCKTDPAGSTVYVNLEPCAHHGRTPPCVARLITSRVGTVVIGMRDPDRRVDGKGIQTLQKAGIEVIVGVLEKEARELNRAYCKTREHGRPLITAKVAASLDGKTATRAGVSQWISSRESRELVHYLRSINDAVLTGTGTVLKDDCRLTARMALSGNGLPPKELWPWQPAPLRNPLRIVLDDKLDLPLEKVIFDTSEAPTLVVTTDQAPQTNMQALIGKGVEVMTIPADRSALVDLPSLFEALSSRGINSVFVECGPKLLTELMKQKLIDRLLVVLAPKLFGSGEAPGIFYDFGVDQPDQAPTLASMRAFNWGPDVWMICETGAA